MKKRLLKITTLSLMIISATSLLFVFFVSISRQVLAAEMEDVAVYPATWDETNPLSKYWFIYSLQPGEIKEDAIELANLTKKQVSLDIYTVDALTTKEGAFALRNKNEPKKDTGAWIALSTNEVNLGPQEVKVIPFTVVVPANADVGDHAGGIVVVQKESSQQTIDQQFGVNVVTRVGVRIYANIPGEIIRQLRITNFIIEKRENQRMFILELTNQGNVRLEPEGELMVKNIFGKEIFDSVIEKRGEIFPKDTISKEIPWRSKFYQIGRFVAQSNIIYGPGLAVSRYLIFWIIPWWLIAIIIIVLLIIIYLLNKKYRKNKKNKQQQKTVNFV